MEILLNLMPVIIALLAFAAGVAVCCTYRPSTSIVKVYERVNNRLREVPKGLFDYEQTAAFLTAQGAAWHIGRHITPVKYLLYRCVLALLLLVIGMRYLNPLVAVLLMLPGFWLPKLYVLRANHNDNIAMLDQLQSLYSMLQHQIMAGVYVTDALAEAYQGIDRGRLHSALEELSGEILLKKSFTDAMEHFNAKFENSMIDSLCVILIQAQESGQTAELLKDMADQLKDLQMEGLLKKKEHMDRVETMCIMGIIVIVLGLVIYSCVQTMFQSALAL